MESLHKQTKMEIEMSGLKEVTYREAGLTKVDMYSLVFNELVKYPDGLEIKDIFKVVNAELANKESLLSKQGEDTLRNLISAGAVSDGFIHPFNKENPKWRLTNEGKKLVEQQGQQKEKGFNTETGNDDTDIPNIVKGTDEFEEWPETLAKMPLQKLRNARGLSQKVLAEALHLQQPAITKLEKRTDIYISTLRSHIKAMGGDLDITARFPDGDVKIANFSQI